MNLDSLRLLLMQSGTRLLFNTCDKTIITILNFKISGRRGGGGGGGENSSPPLYETLVVPCHSLDTINIFTECLSCDHGVTFGEVHSSVSVGKRRQCTGGEMGCNFLIDECQ